MKIDVWEIPKIYTKLQIHVMINISKRLVLKQQWSQQLKDVDVFLSCLDFNNPLTIKNCCSNESISDIDFRTLINALDLSHFAARSLLRLI